MKIFGKYSRPLLYIFSSYKKHKILMVFMILWKIMEATFSVIIPILAKLEMDQLAEKNEQLFGFIEASSFNIFIIILIIIFVGQFVQKFLSGLLDLFSRKYLEIYENEFQVWLYSRLKYSQVGIFLNIRNERFVRDILSDAGSMMSSLERFIGGFITNSILFVGISSVLVMTDWRIFVVLIISTIIMYFLEKIRHKLKEKMNLTEHHRFEMVLWSTSHEMSFNFPQLISSGAFSSVLNIFSQATEEKREMNQKNQNNNFVITIAEYITDNFTEIAMKLIVWFSVFAGTTSLGTMTMTLLYIEKIQSVFDYLRRVYFDFWDLHEGLMKFDLFLDLTENKNPNAISHKNFAKISFKNVKFSYPNFAKHELRYLQILEETIKRFSSKRDMEDEIAEIAETKKELSESMPLILRGVDMEFETGKTYGIVGKNGAGKTTITALLQKFFENFSWQILIDSTDIREFSRDFFEENIAIIHQIPYIIESLSIRENILFGSKKTISDKEIFDLLDKFGLAKKILKNKKWLDARIGWDGNFSGGEKQLIVLARIILQDKKILIMDEWTNQLDAENEMLVMNELLKHKKDKIVIFITHRMTTIRKVDKIYTLKDGKIEASGTHDELIGGDNMYNFFWKTQVEV